MRHDTQAECGGCGATWYGSRACHCAAPGCHRTFATVGLFDAHRSTRGGEHGSCLDPETLVIQTGPRAGDRTAFLRDGMWRGPEMTEAQKLARFGERSPA